MLSAPGRVLPSMCTPAPDTALYLVFVLIPLLGGILSFAASDNSPSALVWRRSLTKSRLSPSTIPTAVLWVFLYISMGTASFRVYSCIDSPVLSAPVVAYITQLLLNHFYIIVLFGLQRIDLAMIMMLPLWLATAVTTASFYDVDTLAGRLMAFVLAWVSFTVYLNGVLYVCNPVYTEFGFRKCDDDAVKRKVA